MHSRFESMARDELAGVVPELLLLGHMIDRAGMPWCTATFGPDEMTQIAIEEWAGASPIYTRRMQRAFGFEGDDVVTIFKGMQLDIGAPPQFMDFRYSIQDRWHGSFHLDHCGALLDVEPVGESFVRAMCHDIEDPTFDATAVATNPKARMRPIHRPPRRPADRHPHCAWTVSIDEDSPAVSAIPALALVEAKHAASLPLEPVDRSGPGRPDYSGDLLDDVDFAGFSHSALVRMADEVCLEMHLLNLSFGLAVAKRAPDAAVLEKVLLSQLVGHAGVCAERLHRCLGTGTEPADVAALLLLLPMFNPQRYVAAVADGPTISVALSPAHEDGSWIELCGPASPRPLQAAVRAVDPYLDVMIEGRARDWTATVVRSDRAAPECDEVAVTRFSAGVGFRFEPRSSHSIHTG